MVNIKGPERRLLGPISGHITNIQRQIETTSLKDTDFAAEIGAEHLYVVLARCHCTNLLDVVKAEYGFRPKDHSRQGVT
jgi:hypothetical protein